MLTHLSGIILGFIVPLVIWLINKDKADKGLLNDQAKEALNFQITIADRATSIGMVLTIILIGPLISLAVVGGQRDLQHHRRPEGQRRRGLPLSVRAAADQVTGVSAADGPAWAIGWLVPRARAHIIVGAGRFRRETDDGRQQPANPATGPGRTPLGRRRAARGTGRGRADPLVRRRRRSMAAFGVWMLVRDKSAFAAAHAKEAANFNLSMFLYACAAGVVGIVLVGATVLTLGLGALVTIPAGILLLCVIAAIALMWLVCSFIAAFKAWDGKPYRYPLTIRLLG